MDQASNTLVPSYTNSLVQTPAASSFLSLAGTDAGRKAFIGDPEKFDSGAGPNIVTAHIALRDGVETIGMLLQDPTRNDVQRHEAAGVVAGRTVEALQKAKAAIESRAEPLLMDGQEDARRALSLDPSRRFLHDRIMDHMIGLVGASDGSGMLKLRQLVNDDGEAAQVFANAKSYLLRMNADNFNKLHFEVVERHVPNAHKKMTDGADLMALAPNYDKAVNSVRSSFYNPTIAARAKLRVQI